MKLPSLLLCLCLPAAAQTVRLPGELAPFQRVSIMARVAGIVETVAVDRGSAVRAGDALLVLRAPEMQARIAEAEAKASALDAQRVEGEARLISAESRYERLKSAGATPGVVAELDIILAEKERDAAKMLVSAFERSANAARAQTAALKEMEAYLRIAAPFDGIITARHVHPGALASPDSGSLLELEQVSRLRLILPVPEAQLAGIRQGRRLEFKVPAHPGRTFTATIARIPRSLDPATRTMPIELDVPNPNAVLAPGMYCEVAWPQQTAAGAGTP
jgi:membrane fusion protein, multidrug efflux system